MLFRSLRKPEHRRLDTYDKFKKSFISIVKSLKKNERMIIAGGELGFACGGKIMSEIRRALKRGASVDVFAGPYLMSEKKCEDKKDLIGSVVNKIVAMYKSDKDRPDNLRLFIAEDYAKSTDFHFILFGKYLNNIQVEYPHAPDAPNTERIGFRVDNSKKWSSWLKDYLNHGMKSGNYKPVSNYSDIRDRVKTKKEFADEIQESEDYKVADERRVALFYNEDEVARRKFVSKSFATSPA